MTKRILVISWFYPPINSSEGLVTYKLLKSSKYEYDVFTQKENTLWSYGNKNELPKNKNVKCIYSKSKKIEDWKNEAKEYYIQNKEKYDIVMTRSMPPESHQIGLEIKKINSSIKWIASFGDPIAENPYTKFSITYPSPHSIKTCTKFRGIISPKRIIKNTMFKIRYKRLRKIALNGNLKLQNQIFEKADFIIYNNKYQQEYMLQNQAENIKNKSVILNHSFDKTLYSKIKKKNSKIKMTYIGHLDEIRTPGILLEAIEKLYKEDKNLSDKILFEFYGNMSDSDKLYIVNSELTDIVKVKKSVSYLESIKIMQQSDWLLLVDANISSVCEKNIFFAAKLADYIGTGNKIFGITMIDGVSADILRELNAVVATYSTEQVKNYLWKIIYDNYEVEIDNKFCKNFDSVSVAKKFDELIESILDNNKKSKGN